MARTRFATFAETVALVSLLGLSLTPRPVAAQTDTTSPLPLTPPAGTYTTTDGQTVPFATQYRLWFPQRPPDPRYLRAAIEVAALIGIGTAHYWLNKETNQKDWDFPNFVDRATFKGIRFDNNTFLTNFFAHPLAGAGYYAFSRANNLSVIEAAINAELGSLIWEYGLEWREQVSINDMVFTPVAGIAIGEFVHHLGNYLHSSPDPTWAHQTAALTLGLPEALHRLDPTPRRTSPELDNLGLSSNYWHDFEVNYEFASTANDANESQALNGAEVSAQLIAMPGFQRPSHLRKLFVSGNFTEMRAHLLYNDAGTAEGEAWFSSTLAGYYSQDYVGKGTDVSGSSVMIGAGTALTYLSRFTLGRKDQRAMAHFAGPHFGYWWRHGKLAARLSGEAHGDLAALRSLPFAQVREDFPDDTFKAVLEEQGYQFHLGASSYLRADLSYDIWTLNARTRVGRYSSVEGVDRRAEEITKDVEGDEILFQNWVSLRLDIPYTPLATSLGYMHDWRESREADLTVRRSERRVFTTLGLHL